ncbi:MAG: ATP-binding protein [Bacteroidaceae bacterium]|nr:ATP-binding protein [Bacteroidaceae bacterium]
MNNPFKFGTIVDGQYFTDRTKELQYVEQILKSENHLVLISPRRFGKSSLVNKALEQTERKHIVINMQSVTSIQNFASRLMGALFRLYPGEKMKHLMMHFRVVPTVSTNPMNGSVDVTFNPSMNTDVILEDAMELLQKVSTEKNRLIVVLDEFQEIDGIKGFDKQLRSIMQTQQHINYVFLGSQESMMESIFEKKKSPFYHFGQLMRLAKIPYEDFKQYVAERLNEELAEEILAFTNCHPYYTLQIAAQVWDLVNYEHEDTDLIPKAIERLVTLHDLDFERLWLNFNKSDRRVLQELSKPTGNNPLADRSSPTSTTFSILKKLMRQGYVIKTNRYEIEDPFFRRWVEERG